MESLTDITGGQTTENGGEPMKPGNVKSARATKSEMAHRQQEVLTYLRKHENADLYQLAKAMKLTNPQVLTLITTLQKSGKIERAGRDGRRIVYQIAKPSVSVVDVTPETKPVPAPSVDLPVHLGELLEVVAIHITDQGVKVELRDDDKMLMTLVA